MSAFIQFRKTLESKGVIMVDNIRKELAEKNKNATSSLSKGTKATTTFEGESIIFRLIAPEHWVFVDKGRKPGKFPPPKAIERWIKAKPVGFEGIKISSLAYLIGRKIAKDGIKATGIYSSNIERFKRDLVMEAERDMREEFRKQILQQFNTK